MIADPDCPRRVLMVEDDAADAQQIKDQFLAKNDRIIFDVVADAATARAQIDRGRLPDFILLDRHLPGDGAFQLLRHLRSQETLKAIPVIVLTTSDDPADIHEAYVRGANAVVQKVGEREQFETKVDATITFWCNVAYLPSELNAY